MIILYVLGILLAGIWLIMPFYIIGSYARLGQIEDHTKRQLDVMTALHEHLTKESGEESKKLDSPE